MAKEEEEENDVPGISGVPVIEPLEHTFFDDQLRRAYLEDVPTALTGGVVPSAAAFPATPSTGQLFWRTDRSKLYIYTGAAWLQIPVLDANGNLIISGRYLKE